MLYGQPVTGELGFSLNPLHYVKKGVVAVGHGVKAGAKGIYKIDKAVIKNKYVQKAAAIAANAAAPGSGAIVSAGFSTINSKPGGPAATVGPMPGPQPAPGQPPGPNASAPATGDDGSGGGGGGSGGGSGGGAKMFGLPKKYVMIGGAVLGGVVLLSLLTPKRG